MTSSPPSPNGPGVALSIVLVALAVVIAWRQHLGLARAIVIAAVRCGVQLLAVGAVLLFLFNHAGLPGGFAWLTVMVVSRQVAGRRGKGPTGPVCGDASGGGGGRGDARGAAAVRVIDSGAAGRVPVGGMVSAGDAGHRVTLARMVAEAKNSRAAIEARLSLGLSAPGRLRAPPPRAPPHGPDPHPRPTKVVGLISLPGAMTG